MLDEGRAFMPKAAAVIGVLAALFWTLIGQHLVDSGPSRLVGWLVIVAGLLWIGHGWALSKLPEKLWAAFNAAAIVLAVALAAITYRLVLPPHRPNISPLVATDCTVLVEDLDSAHVYKLPYEKRLTVQVRKYMDPVTIEMVCTKPATVIYGEMGNKEFTMVRGYDPGRPENFWVTIKEPGITPQVPALVYLASAEDFQVKEVRCWPTGWTFLRPGKHIPQPVPVAHWIWFAALAGYVLGRFSYSRSGTPK
jgi:hypothetical protein